MLVGGTLRNTVEILPQQPEIRPSYLLKQPREKVKALHGRITIKEVLSGVPVILDY